jgi:transglutaminase superfamily protein/uncharacterized protein DUF4129
MTARTADLPRYVDGGALARRLQPAEGWLTLVAIAALPWTLGWSLDDAGWVPRVEGATGYLPWLAVASAIVGIIVAKLPLGRFRADLVGAIVGGLVVPFVGGGVVLANQASLGLDPVSILERYQAAATVGFHVWRDLVIEGRPFTTEYGHYHMIFAGFLWAAGILAATATIRRRRPLDAVIVAGVLLLTNMALTAHEQLQILVVFSIAALTLLLRTHVFEEQLTWVRRRIGDPVAVGGLYLQGGAAFVGAAVLGALVLTGSASSAPLQGMWADMPQRLAELSRLLQRFAPTGGDTRNPGAVSFGATVTTRGLFNPDKSAVAFVATLPASSPHFKWRAGAYSTYTLYGWDWGTTHPIVRDATVPLLEGTGDDPNDDVSRTTIRIQIAPQAFIDSAAVSPLTIDWVDRPSTVLGVGEQNRFTTVQLAGGSGPYTEQVLIPNIGDATGGITENRLRAAGRNYPSDIDSVYLQLPDNAIGPAAQAILDQVEARFGSKADAEAKPYDLARALEGYLHDPANFTYATDVQAKVRAQCDGVSTVECFARIRRGYCEYYASTMTVLLRAAGIPARVAYGFLPGTRTAEGIETVPASAMHWWVEVYFPRSGWVEFDPTGGVGQPAELPSGAPVTPPPSGLFTLRPDRETDPIAHPSGQGGPGGVVDRRTGSGPFVVVGIILAIAVVIIGWAARRRSPRMPMHPDQAWGGLGRLAARFGFGPRPEQTVYEYAGALSDLVPAVRVEVGTVARAKVEVAYGRRELGVDRLRTVGDAYRRLRFAVLRVGLVRRFRRRRR